MPQSKLQWLGSMISIPSGCHTQGILRMGHDNEIRASATLMVSGDRPIPTHHGFKAWKRGGLKSGERIFVTPSNDASSICSVHQFGFKDTFPSLNGPFSGFEVTCLPIRGGLASLFWNHAIHSYTHW